MLPNAILDSIAEMVFHPNVEYISFFYKNRRGSCIPKKNFLLNKLGNPTVSCLSYFIISHFICLVEYRAQVMNL
jgi:hypothetical protein